MSSERNSGSPCDTDRGQICCPGRMNQGRKPAGCCGRGRLTGREVASVTLLSHRKQTQGLPRWPQGSGCDRTALLRRLRQHGCGLLIDLSSGLTENKCLEKRRFSKASELSKTPLFMHLCVIISVIANSSESGHVHARSIIVC